MKTTRTGRSGAAALVLLAALGLWCGFAWWSSPTLAQVRCSDPLVQVMTSLTGLWIVPVLATAMVLAHLTGHSLRRSDVEAAAFAVVMGAGIVAGGLLLANAVGPRPVPWFVPPEESACPGLFLGYTAALLEEAIFRMGVLPVVFALLGTRLARGRAAAIAVVVTGFAFALSHETGAAGFNAAHAATRFLFPGCFMSALWLRPGPPYPVALHCALHVVIPSLYA